MNEKVTCLICNQEVLHIGVHLKSDHPDTSIADYQKRFPGAPIMSEAVRQRIADAQAERAAKTQINMQGPATASNVSALPIPDRKVTMHDAFGLGATPAAKNARGESINLTMRGSHAFEDMVPDQDPAYIFNIELLKQICLALEVDIPLYIWGYHGTGKTSAIQQVASRLNMPAYRIQHTLNMIESDVIGDWRAKDGNTYFELGPLPLAMLNGWVYIADEYDRAPPGVVSLYQAVLEGQPLVIKEAPPEHRVIRPAKGFRIVATGNTNGSGDDSGLYSGTMIGDAANYSRFGITERAPYMDRKAEAALLQAKCGIPKEWADDLVRWAGMVREAFDARKITTTVGPRELLNSGRVGAYRNDLKLGIRSSIINRMNDVDRVVAEELMQRVFG